MPVTAVRLVRSRNAAGDVVVRLGVRLLDEYLEFLAGRCRPNTVLAVAYDLKVFFAVVGKPPRRVRGRCAGVHDRAARWWRGPAAGRRAGRRGGVGADAAAAARLPTRPSGTLLDEPAAKTARADSARTASTSSRCRVSVSVRSRHPYICPRTMSGIASPGGSISAVRP